MVVDKLDRQAKLVLEALYQHGGEAETGEIKSYTGIEKRGTIHYRLDHPKNDNTLEALGLVETRKIDAEGGSQGVKVSTLTDRGHEVVARVLDDESGPTLDEQVRSLKSDVDDLREEVAHFDGRVDHVEARIGDVEETTEAQVEEVLDRLGDREALAEAVDRAEEVASRFDDVVEENDELRDAFSEFQTALNSLERARIVEESAGYGYKIHADLARFQKLAEAGVFGALVEQVDGGGAMLGLDPDKRGHPETVNDVKRLDGVEVPAVDGERLGRSSEEYADPRVFVPTSPEISAATAEKISRLEEVGLLDGLLSATEEVDLTEAAEVSLDVEVTHADAEEYAAAERTRVAVESLDAETLREAEDVKDLEIAVSDALDEAPDAAVLAEFAAEHGLDTLGWEDRHEAVESPATEDAETVVEPVE